jgi:hypothetical protein
MIYLHVLPHKASLRSPSEERVPSEVNIVESNQK